MLFGVSTLCIIFMILYKKRNLEIHHKEDNIYVVFWRNRTFATQVEYIRENKTFDYHPFPITNKQKFPFSIIEQTIFKFEKKQKKK